MISYYIALPPASNHSSTSIDASGIAKLGHTGARALATRGCAQPVQVLIKILSVPNVPLSIANWALKVHTKVLKSSCVVLLSVPSE